MTPQQVKILERLADGIIPADEIDGGASCVEAARKIAEKIDAGVNAKVYLSGLEFVAGLKETLAIHELLGILREKMPGFFKQLRMDVAAIYLSDAGVWERIGFPGPSSESGGYPDFDRVQLQVHRRDAETQR